MLEYIREIAAIVPWELVVAAGTLVFLAFFGRWLWMTPAERDAIKKAAQDE